MWGVISRYLKDKKNYLLGMTLGILAFLGMYIALFPSIRDSAAQLSQVIEAYPDAFFKAFGMEKSDLSFSTVESYLATEQYSFIWPIMIVVLAVSLANAILVSDIDKGTAELVFSQPMSRIKLFFSRYFAGLLALLGFLAVSVYGAIPFFELYNIDYNFSKFNTIALVGLFFAVSVYSMATLFSVIFSEKGKSSFAASGIIILMYVVNVISSLEDSLSNLKYTSFFYYFSPTLALNKGELVDWALLVFGIFSIVATLTAAYWFNRRDIAV
jgi:ABC-2 type transport system permease protein